MGKVLGRGRLRFSLTALLLMVTLAAITAWIGSQVRLIRQRRDLCQIIVEHQGLVESAAVWNALYVRKTSARVPTVRGWLGDDAVARLRLPYGSEQADLERANLLFPEAELIEIARHPPRPGDGYM